MPTSFDKRILANMVKHIQHSAEDPLTPLVDEYLIKRAQRDVSRVAVSIDMRPRYRPGKRLSPSSIGGCERAAVFQFCGIRGTKRINPDTELIFETGDWFHHKWQTLFLDMQEVLGKDRIEVGGIEEHVEHRPLYIAGSLDLRVKAKIDGEMRWIVIDVKSINDRGYSNVVNAGEPVEEHVRQVTTYMRAAKCKYGALLYENKDKSAIVFFVFKYDKKIWGKVKRWCESVIGALETKSLPPKHPDCVQGNFLYERCPHKGLCYGDMDRVQLKHLAYDKFPGLDALWEEGLEDEETL